MNICIVVGGKLPVPDVRGGAIERLVTILAQENEKKYYANLTVLTHFNKEAITIQKVYSNTKFVNIPTYGKMYYRIVWKLIQIIRFITGKTIRTLHIYEYRVAKYLKENGHKYDMIVDEGAPLSIFEKVADKLGKEKLCVHLHMNQLSSPSIEKTFGSAIGVSDFISKQFYNSSTLSSNVVKTVFNGIDICAFQERITEVEKEMLKEKLGFHKDDFIILFCGRIVPQKGVKELIQALLKIKNASIKLLIIGSSNFALKQKDLYAREVEKMIDLQQDRIRFTGYVPNKDLYKYHQISNIGVVPSTYADPCPLAFIELISSGLPTIATALGGMLEIGNETTSIFVSYNNIVDELASSILRLYNDKKMQKEMSEAAIIRSKYFSSDRFCNDYFKALNDIVHEYK